MAVILSFSMAGEGVVAADHEKPAAVFKVPAAKKKMYASMLKKKGLSGEDRVK